ncbi:MAG: hypothetical protein KY475_21675 [Planctomycetes bacterium]|nr:hypothetical protein [Planctomycetota bacterium]
MMLQFLLGGLHGLRRRTNSVRRRPSFEFLEARWAPATVELFADLVTMGSSRPTAFIEHDGYLYFVAQSDPDQDQWWRLNGSGNVTLVNDTIPRRGFAERSEAVVFQDELYLPFVGGGLGQYPLYKIDSEGDFEPAIAGGDWRQVAPDHLTVFGGTLYYEGGEFEDRELWRFAAGGNPHRVADIHASGSSQPSDLTVIGDTLYFSADDGVHGRELWMSDGAGSAHLIADVLPGAQSSNPEQLTRFGDELYFWAQASVGESYGLWKLDAAGNAQKAAELYAAPETLVRPGMTVFDGRLHVFAKNGAGAEQLWKVDAQGNVAVAANVSPGPQPPEAMAVFNDALYFRAYESVEGYELWRLGRSGPATRVTTFGRNDAFLVNGMSFAEFGGELYFAASDRADDFELWKIDAQGNATMAADIHPGSSLPGDFTPFGDRLFFRATFPGNKAWTIDRQGNVELRDFGEPSLHSPEEFTAWQGDLYFRGSTPETGVELWKLQPPDQASLVGDLWPGEGDSFPIYFTEAHGALYFRAWDEAHGRELWRLNEHGIVELVADVWPGADHSNPRELATLGDSLYFAAEHPDAGEELWRLDAHGGLTMIELYPGPRSSHPGGFVEYAGVLYFSAQDEEHGRELWKIAPGGSVSMVADTRPGPASFDPLGLVRFNNALYMTATAGEGYKLWKLDSQQQILRVIDGRADPELAFSSTPRLAPVAGLVFGDALYFYADDGVHGGELWRVDTKDQVELVADIYPGPGSSTPSEFAAFNGALYFSASGGRERGGREVWRLVPDAVHHNHAFPADVDADGEAGMTDLLEVVTYLRNGGPEDLSGAAAGPPYVDVNGDGAANLADLLEVVNVLREQAFPPQPQGEGEPHADRAGQDAASSDNLFSGFFFLDDEEFEELAADSFSSLLRR